MACLSGGNGNGTAGWIAGRRPLGSQGAGICRVCLPYGYGCAAGGERVG